MLTQVPDSEMKYFASISIQSLKSTPDFIRNCQILCLYFQTGRKSKEENANTVKKTPLKREFSSPVSRSTSFRNAVRKQPLTSVGSSDDIMADTNSNKTTETSPSKRTQSFRLATRLYPVLKNEVASHSASSLPGTSLVQCKEELPPSSTEDGVFASGESNVDQRYCSMPALAKPQSPSINGSSARGSDSHLTRRLSSNSFNLGSPSKKVIDIKQYFSRPKENLENSQSLKQESKSVTAFHDSFLKKAAENSPERSILMYLFVALRQAIQYPGYSACLLCLYVQMICNGIPHRL